MREKRPVTLAFVISRIAPGSHLQVFVPSRDRSGARIAFAGLLRATNSDLLQIAGGTTTTLAIGRWASPGGPARAERVGIVSVFLPESQSAAISVIGGSVAQFLTRIAVEGDQESVAIAIDGRLYLIDRGAFQTAAA